MPGHHLADLPKAEMVFVKSLSIPDSCAFTSERNMCTLFRSSRFSSWCSGCIVFLTSSTCILSQALQSNCTTLLSWLWLAGHQHHLKEENNGKDPSSAHLSDQITNRCFWKQWALSDMLCSMPFSSAHSIQFWALYPLNLSLFSPWLKGNYPINPSSVDYSLHACSRDNLGILNTGKLKQCGKSTSLVSFKL